MYVYYEHKALKEIMLTAKVTRIVSCLLAIVCLWVSSSGAGEIVLCVGQDGHIALEPVHDPACDEAARYPAASKTEADVARERHHSDCVDFLFPVQAELALTPGNRMATKVLVSTAYSTHDCVAPVDVYTGPKRLAADAALMNSTSTPVLRYTILLI